MTQDDQQNFLLPSSAVLSLILAFIVVVSLVRYPLSLAVRTRLVSGTYLPS